VIVVFFVNLQHFFLLLVLLAVRIVFECSGAVRTAVCHLSFFVSQIDNARYVLTMRSSIAPTRLSQHNSILTMRVKQCSDTRRFSSLHSRSGCCEFEIKIDRAMYFSRSHCTAHVIIPPGQFNFEHSFNLCLDSLLNSFLLKWIAHVVDAVQHQISRPFAQTGFDSEKVDFHEDE